VTVTHCIAKVYTSLLLYKAWEFQDTIPTCTYSLNTYFPITLICAI